MCVPCTDLNVHHWVTLQETILGGANFVTPSEIFSYRCIDGAAVTAYVLKNTQVCNLLCMGPTFRQPGMQKQKLNADMKASRFSTKSKL